MTDFDTKKPGGVGNTSKPLRGRHWVFTWNNPNLTHLEFMETLDKRFEKYIFQLEEGENGTKHFQGYVFCKNAASFTACKKINNEAHWEKCNSPKHAIAYCQKIKTRIEGPWAKGIEIKKKLKLITELLPWQQQVIDIIKEEPDDRTIHWFWEEKGSIGKTQLAKYIVSKYNAVYVSGACKDVFYLISEWKNKDNMIVIFDFARIHENYQRYTSMEKVKDGIFCSTKYESKMCVFDSPHVICFANWPPNEEALSKDRWKITKL